LINNTNGKKKEQIIQPKNEFLLWLNSDSMDDNAERATKRKYKRMLENGELEFVEPFPKLSSLAQNFWEMAKTRDEIVSKGAGYNKHGNKKDPCGKDTKRFWFLLGYFQGKQEKGN